MSDTYTKLFSSITESTVWGEPYSTRIVWVTMLAMADASGNVYAAVPGLARRANVTLQEAEAALAAFMSPDPYSRTKDDDGRRVTEIPGGWNLVTHAKYAAIRNADERREYKREWDRENRPSGHARAKQSDNSPTAVRQNPTNPTSPAPPTPTPTPEKQEPTGKTLAPQESPAPVPTEAREGQQPTAAGITCRLLREAGFGATNPSHPHLLRALNHGVTPEAIRDCALEAKDLGKSSPIQWAYATALSRHQERERPRPAARAGPGAVEQPMGKQMQGIVALEGLKRGNRERVAAGRDRNGAAEVGLLVAGSDACR